MKRFGYLTVTCALLLIAAGLIMGIKQVQEIWFAQTETNEFVPPVADSQDNFRVESEHGIIESDSDGGFRIESPEGSIYTNEDGSLHIESFEGSIHIGGGVAIRIGDNE
ncbi:hypothetical protein M3650_11705 [Paenibacillus sp. MER TA 81-3]|uniref:hypothetical protein n=1 Tax=Paenibacillus sp. MER TA 81-3 TaxID=2939573 RepID=UPI00203D71D1|nr:hypothetical protein [Paenibacillus sp. MER TA 81-3]MCM3339282.1 hypothetical protein [Paenibacillus sp. MER TA 81-3]